jgi:hypothetical protein
VLTIFLERWIIKNDDYRSIDHTTNTSEITVCVMVINDSPMAATIRYWNVSFEYDVPFRVLSFGDSLNYSGPIILTPTAQINFNMTRTVIGENNTRLPEIPSNFIISTYYEDLLGYQWAKRSYPIRFYYG